MKFTNKTDTVQTINGIKENYRVLARQTVEVPQEDLYSFELERLKSFFDFEIIKAETPTANVDKPKKLNKEV
jgi:hypothetical protein